jgi:hypothetical protein
MRLLKISTAAILATALTTPALAQFANPLGSGERTSTRYTEQEKRDEAAREKAYRDTIKNTKGATTEVYDPWRTVRPVEAKPSGKPQK